MSAEQVIDSLIKDEEDRNRGYMDPLMNDPTDTTMHKKLFSDMNTFKVLNKLYHEKNITQHTKVQGQLMQIKDVMKQKDELNKLAMNRQKISPDFAQVLKYKGQEGEFLKLYQYSNAKQNEEENLFNAHF